MLISRAVVIFSWVRLLSFAFVYKGGSRITINRNLRFHTGSDHKYTTRWPKETKVMLREANESSFRIDAVQPSYITPLIVSAIVLTAVAFSQYADVGAVLGATVLKIQNLGPYGYVYFSVVFSKPLLRLLYAYLSTFNIVLQAYVLAEILAVPALPLAASSGYLFGLLPGTLIVLFSATLAASISFYIGRTFLRGWAQNYIAGRFLF